MFSRPTNPSGNVIRAEEVGRIIGQARHRDVPVAVAWYLHKHEGGLFAWLWLKDLPVRDIELYDAVKQERVFFVPGSLFFPATDGGCKHKHECLRLSLTASDEALEKGIAAIARAVARAYRSID